MITVGQLIDDLSRFDRNDPVKIEIKQYNKMYPVACLDPAKSGRMQDGLASKENGIDVRISVNLPRDNHSFMITSTRKI